MIIPQQQQNQSLQQKRKKMELLKKEKVNQKKVIKNFNLIDSEKYLANDYINCTKIDYVFLLRKLLLNYYKQLEIYKERNVKIEKMVESIPIPQKNILEWEKNSKEKRKKRR